MNCASSALTLALLFVGASCAAPAPTFQQGLDYGFRTPEQAFASWKAAVQADLPVHEYRALSKGWRQRNGDGSVSLFEYVEGRESILAANPRLRWALSRSEEPEVIAVGEESAVLRVRIPGALWVQGRTLFVRLVREGFWDGWTADEPDQSSIGARLSVPLPDSTFGYDAAARELVVRVPVKPEYERAAARTDDLALVRVGWEWKVDEFEVREGKSGRD